MSGAVHISARQGQGLDRLLEAIEQTLARFKRRVEFILPYERASVLDMLYQEADVKQAEYGPEGIAVAVVCDSQILGRLREWVPDTRKKEEWED